MEQPTGDRGPERLEVPFEGLAVHTETGEQLDISQAPYQWVENPSVRGIYEHYKSTLEARKLYMVQGVIRNTETHERLVIYRPLYKTDQKAANARPLSEFEESVHVGDVDVPRFNLLFD